MQPFSLDSLRAIPRAGVAAVIDERLAVDLATAARRLVDHGRLETRRHQCLRGTDASRARADDQRMRAPAHGRLVVMMRMPAVSGVEQARKRSPFSHCTQQSWQAPI